MTETNQVLPKAKKSVALSGTAAGNTALCTVGRRAAQRDGLLGLGQDLFAHGLSLIHI